MELEGEDGSKLELRSNSDTVFGRAFGFNTKDRTVSRHHVIFHLGDSTESETDSRVSFQVAGRNPLWVRRGEGEKIEVFRNSESGDAAAGDGFCVSSQSPVWFNVRRIQSVDLENFDISKIDPVKEFGFLVIGHEFDCYPKQRVRGVNNWHWFLEESETRSDDDDDGGGNKKRRKRKKSGGGNEEEDEDWTGESEEDKEVVLKKAVGVRPKYLTRSKDAIKPRKDVKRKKISREEEEEEEEEEDEEDETLGGFIVNDENEEEEEELDENEDDEEEEEFVDGDE